MASKVKFDLRIEISNLSYHGVDVHIASNILRVASEAMAASKRPQ